MFKDTPNGQTNYYLSECCHATVGDLGIDGIFFTSKYECHECGEECDIIPASELSK